MTKFRREGSAMSSSERARERFEREQNRQREINTQLENSFIKAFAEWLGEMAKSVVKTAVHLGWEWLKSWFLK